MAEKIILWELWCEIEARTFHLRWNDNRGALLIGVIIGIILVAGLGTAMLSLFSTASRNITGYGNQMQAYYLAESGGRYVKDFVLLENDIDNDPSQTYTLLPNGSNSDKFAFTVASYDATTGDYAFQSTGTTSSGRSKTINYRRVTGDVTDIAIPDCGTPCRNRTTTNPGADDIDELFDGNFDNRGYRSRTENNEGSSFIAYEVGFGLLVTDIRIWRFDADDSVSSIRIQYSDNYISWADVWTWDLGYSTGSGSSVTYSVTPATVNYGVRTDVPHRYWRLLANSETQGRDEWNVNELEITGKSILIQQW